MEKNRLVERKMTLFRKKKQLQVAKFGKIQELDEEDDANFLWILILFFVHKLLEWIGYHLPSLGL